MESEYEFKDVKNGSLKFQVGGYEEAVQPDYSSQIQDFELLSKGLDPKNANGSSSVEYFEPVVVKNANITVEEKPAVVKNDIDLEDSVKIYNNWAQMACKLEENLEKDFLEENVKLEIFEEDKDIKETFVEEELKPNETEDWNKQMKNFEGFAKKIEKKNTKTKSKNEKSEKSTKLVPNNRTCKYCGVEFPSYRLCFYHQKTVHEGVWHKCNSCDYVNARKDHIRIHREKEHDNVRYPCKKCDYKGKTRSHLKMHDERIHQQLQFDCDICKFTCKSKSTLSYHVQMIHQGIGHQCPKCEYKTTTLGKLQCHIKALHDKVKDLQCDQCEFRTGNKRSLKLHLQVHEGAQFRCDFCDKVCAQRGSILRHMKVKHQSQIVNTQS